VVTCCRILLLLFIVFFFFPAGIAKILQHDSLLTLFLPCGLATGTVACYAAGQSIGHHFKCIKLPFHPQDLSLGYSGRGMALTTHPHLVPRLKKDKSYTFTPTLGLHDQFLAELLQSTRFQQQLHCCVPWLLLTAYLNVSVWTGYQILAYPTHTAWHWEG
jgi:hypothetical protein